MRDICQKLSQVNCRISVVCDEFPLYSVKGLNGHIHSKYKCVQRTKE